MKENNYKRSRLTSYTWIAISVFFVIFCSCPVKRYIKLQVYKNTTPIESISGSYALSKELKDGNLIDKHGLIKKVAFAKVTTPKPHFADFFPAIFVLPLFSKTDIICFFKRKPGIFLQNHTPEITSTIPLYLRCNKLQV